MLILRHPDRSLPPEESTSPQTAEFARRHPSVSYSDDELSPPPLQPGRASSISRRPMKVPLGRHALLPPCHHSERFYFRGPTLRNSGRDHSLDRPATTIEQRGTVRPPPNTRC